MGSAETPKIFITHSWHDIEFARRLYNDLKARGYQVWFDASTLQGGQLMAEEISRGLESCDIYLPVLSPQALESPWCREEINIAITLSTRKERRGRPRIIPLFAEECQVPTILSARLYIDLSREYPAQVAKLYSAIDGHRFVCYGSKIQLVHRQTGRRLHSQPIAHSFPCSSKQQLVTAYKGTNPSYDWLVKSSHERPEGFEQGQPVKNGEIIRLEHIQTGLNLHSHYNVPSPLSAQHEITAYGSKGRGNGDDNWRIELDSADLWQALAQIKLIHTNTNFALHSHPLSHEQYTAGEQEVTGYDGRNDDDWWLAEIIAESV